MNGRHYILSFMVLAILGCGREINTYQVSDQVEPVAPVFVFMGGFHSCPHKFGVPAYHLPLGAAKTSDMYRISGFREIVAAYEKNTGVKPKTFFTCYSNVILGTVFDQFHLRYAAEDPTFHEHGQILVKNSNLDDRNLRSIDFLNPMLNSLSNVISQASAQGKPEVYLFGHSYGGFTAIQAAAYLSSQKIKIAGLTTIDPISLYSCSAKKMISDPSATLTGSQTGCDRSPSDRFSVQSIKQLKTATNLSWWYNIYQDRFKNLHSSPIKVLETWGHASNYKMNPADEDIPGLVIKDAHSYLGIDANMWQTVVAKKFQGGDFQ